MDMILLSASLFAVVLGLAAGLLLWNKFKSVSRAEPEPIDLAWTRGVLQRLFNPQDLQSMQAAGCSKDMIRKFRSQRRRIFRAYLGDVIGEFDRIHRTL